MNIRRCFFKSVSELGLANITIWLLKIRVFGVLVFSGYYSKLMLLFLYQDKESNQRTDAPKAKELNRVKYGESLAQNKR